ncbi:MAG: DUF448 domain-containing protein [Actinobacteria bacterium]|nr:DUF448 domain-containing protein [Actinomycetota bacterium]
MAARGHVPRRRCVGCGRVAPKAELLRIVVRSAAPVLDPEQREPGRGRYLCGGACAQEAVRRRAFGRAVADTADFVESMS